jgi:hypothetical protein
LIVLLRGWLSELERHGARFAEAACQPRLDVCASLLPGTGAPPHSSYKRITTYMRMATYLEFHSAANG